MDGETGVEEMEANKTQEQNPSVRNSGKGSRPGLHSEAPGSPEVPAAHFSQSGSATERGMTGRNGKLREVVFAHLRNEGVHFELSL